MTDEPNTPRPEPTPPPQPEAAEQQAAANEVDEKVGELQNQVADLTDRLLRAHAEMENLRKRAAKEREDTAKYAIQKFAGDVVNVADNFERAILSVPQDAVGENAAFKSLLDGVSLTEREFLNVLDRHGVKRLSPQGEQFNPHQHQAVMEAQDPSVAAGTIVQVFQTGYVIQDRVLRPAMVVVAKGGPKQPKPATGEDGQSAAQAQPAASDPASEPDKPAQDPTPPPQQPEDSQATNGENTQPPPPDRDIIL